MNIGEKLAWYRTKAGHTQESLAAESGLARPAISSLERNKGGSPSIDTLKKLLTPCGVTLEEFFREPGINGKPIEKPVFHKLDMMLHGKDEQFVTKLMDVVFDGLKADHAQSDDAPKIKEPLADYGGSIQEPTNESLVQYYEDIAAGTATEMYPPSHLFIGIPRNKVKNSWYALRVWGDSMTPKYNDGDFVLLEPNPEPRNGVVVAALIDGTDNTLKLFSQHGDKVTLTPVNTDGHKPKTYQADRVTIQGVVIEAYEKVSGTLRRKE